jgi:hypothetical protein
MIVGKGSVLYIQAPMLTPYLPATTRWIKVDPASLPGSHGELDAATAAANPAAILGAIKDALTVEEVGADTVDGSKATHYRATVDLVKLLPLLADMASDGNKPTGAEMQEAKDQLTKSGLETLPVEVWVNEDGFLKQMRLMLDLSSIDPDHRGTSISLTLTLSDIGQPISIDVPPASQVTDMTDVLQGALSPDTSSLG